MSPRKPAQTTQRLNLLDGDNEGLANLCGPLEQNLRSLEAGLDVAIRRRGSVFEVVGPQEAARMASELLSQLASRAHTPVSLDDIQLAVVESQSDPLDDEQAIPDGPDLRVRRRDLRGRTSNQRVYLRAISEHDINFGIGPAGTGKTYLAVACAVDALERDLVQRIVLTRPAVEAGERLGFLPGDLNQKVDPYLRPLYDALYDLMGLDRVTKLYERQAIEVAPLAYMRGRTLNHAFVILDEAQNTTVEQMKMFLTRIGFGSKAVITGDPSQVDLPKHQTSGLQHAMSVLEGVRGLSFTTFSSRDVVRHPLVARIVDAYAAFEEAGSGSIGT
ncbi:MAG: PhoH family protein [Betaproteobacteria bacterium]|nr:PhoH family protein [Betaproteobacteria bacterium]